MNTMESVQMDPQWIIDDSTPMEHPNVTGHGFGAKGYVERDVDKFPVYGASPSGIIVASMDDWPEICEETEKKQSNLFHIRNRCGPGGGPMPYLNQGSFPYCWKHSATHAIMLQLFGIQNQKYEPLSAFSLCPDVHSGGWAALAFEYAMKYGVAPQSVVPQGRDVKATPAILKACEPYKIAEGWWDAGKHPGLRNLTFGQVFQLIMVERVPSPVEFNWQGHSVTALRVVDRKDRADKKDLGRYDLDILNSWLNWGVNGVGRYSGSKKIPDSSVGLTSGNAA